jgi:hypothetical protein
MEAGNPKSLSKTDLHWVYRRAFEDYSQKVQQVQRLTIQPNPDRAAIEEAVLAMEKARLFYSECRDALARQLLLSSRKDPLTPRSDTSSANSQRVRGIAELLWEASGRPEGTADEDWYRAEEILRRATTV